MNSKAMTGWAMLATAVVVLGMKIGAWWLTGSITLLSDALESTINVATAIAGLVALRISTRPADENHPYGHDKAEYLYSVIESTLVLTLSLLIFREAWQGWQTPHLPSAPLAGLLLNAASSVIGVAWSMALMRVGWRWKSPALTTGGHHVTANVLTSCGVVAGFWLLSFTGYARLDAIVAVLIGLNVLRLGVLMLRRSVAGLMDEGMEPEALADVRRVIAENADGAIEAHDLRTRHTGMHAFIEFHLVVSGDMTVDRSHEICDRLEQAIRDTTGNAKITIHVEPEDKAKHKGVVVL